MAILSTLKSAILWMKLRSQNVEEKQQQQQQQQQGYPEQKR